MHFCRYRYRKWIFKYGIYMNANFPQIGTRAWTMWAFLTKSLTANTVGILDLHLHLHLLLLFWPNCATYFKKIICCSERLLTAQKGLKRYVFVFPTPSGCFIFLYPKKPDRRLPQAEEYSFLNTVPWSWKPGQM